MSKLTGKKSLLVAVGTGVITLSLPACMVAQTPGEIPTALEGLHRNLWTRCIAEPQGLVLDYTLGGDPDLLPTAEEATAGKPNAISWWTPLENGAFFTGLYLDGILRRQALTKSGEDREKARRLARGLMLCASVGTTPGFVARGVLADGKSHYGIGSDDQTAPWFYGLWRYLRSDIHNLEEKKEITAKLVEVAEAIRANGWQMPCDPVGILETGQFRGGWNGHDYRSVTRLLFVARIIFELTGDPGWKATYEQALVEKLPNGLTRPEVAARGIPGEWEEHPQLAIDHIYIYVVSQAMMAELRTLEGRPEVTDLYTASLRTSAQAVAHQMPPELTRLGTKPFRTDWRVMNTLWQPQSSVGEAVDIALKQLTLWQNGGRNIEAQVLREPFCAAWISALSPEAHREEILTQLERSFDTVAWDKVSSSAGFFGECAWYAASEKASPRAEAVP